MMNSKPVVAPLSPQFKIMKSVGGKSKEEKSFMSTIPYVNVVGSVMYAMVYTRPDLSYGMSVVSRFMADPSKEHWYALKWF